MMRNENENRVCGIVQDLLPLYHDGVCSEESLEYVRKHLAECPSCQKLLKELDEDEVEAELKEEAGMVLNRHAKRETSLALKTGFVIAGILLLPVLIAVLLTLPGYLDWRTDEVLLASMLLVGGMTVVPLVSKKKKLLKALIWSAAALLILIFMVEMMFDEGSLLRFFEIAFATLFGLSVAFAPVVIRQADLPEMFQNQKALLTIIWDTLLFYLMLTAFSIEFPAAKKELFGVSSFFAALAWLIFIVFRYLKATNFTKWGIAIALMGTWSSIGNKVGWITFYGKDIHTGLLIGSLLAGAVLAGIGAVARKRRFADKNRKAGR